MVLGSSQVSDEYLWEMEFPNKSSPLKDLGLQV